MTMFFTVPAYAAEEAEAAEKRHTQPIMSPPGVPIGPIMPVRQPAKNTLSSSIRPKESGFFARQWARLRQFSIEESPSQEK
jgi:hypothetical protein